MESALDGLRARFPNQVVIGFEEAWDKRPDKEPHVDLGPSDATIADVLARMRRDNTDYMIDLLPGGLVHVYPRGETADPPGLLDLKLSEFFLPPNDCIEQQMAHYMDSAMPSLSYTPELGKYLWAHKEAWYQAYGKQVGGIVGDFLGNCTPNRHRRQPIYRNITVREALNLMALRTLRLTAGTAVRQPATYWKPRPLSWKYRFRPDPGADTGLNGVPVFQIF